MKVKLRPATLYDMKEMQNIFVETIRSTCKKDYSQEQIDVWTSSVENKDRWENFLTNQYCIIVEIDNRIVGYGSLDKGNYLDFMYVHKDYLGQGVANRIYQELEKESKRLGYSKMTSDVSKTARAFFEKKGFKVVKENKNEVNGVEIVNFHMTQ